jgi:hypothetical protein
MPKKNKKSGHRPSKHKRKAAPTELSAGVMEWSTAGELIAYWNERLGAGFVPAQVREAIAGGPASGLSDEESGKLEALAVLTDDPLGESRNLNNLPGVPASALEDKDTGRLFVAGANGEGLVCLDLQTGGELWRLDAEQLHRPGGMAQAGEILVVCDRWKHRILAVSTGDGSLCWTVNTAESEEDRLDEPSDVAPVENGDHTEFWITDRSNHRICRYTKDGRCLGILGRRGLTAEEIIWNYTRDPQQPEAVFMEFPESLSVATDIDKQKSVFVWDSGNCRLLCFTTSGDLKRIIPLERTSGGGTKTAFRLRVLDTANGPLPVAMDEQSTALMLWTAHGELVLRCMLEPALFGLGPMIETARIITTRDSGLKPALVTSRAAMVEFKEGALDLPKLLEARAVIQPDKARWLLALWEIHRISGNDNQILTELWSGPLAKMEAGEFVKGLLSPDSILDGGLGRNLYRIEAFIDESCRSGFQKPAYELSQAVDNRLESLAGNAEKKLLALTRPGDEKLDNWSETKAVLDLAVFKNKGNNQVETLRLDSILEEIRDLPDMIRRTAWTCHTLYSELARRKKDPSERLDTAVRLASQARELLDRRVVNMLELEQELDFSAEPNQVKLEEVKAIHRCLITVDIIGQVAEALAGRIAFSVNGDRISGELTASLRECAGLGPEGDFWEKLYKKTAAGSEESGVESMNHPARAGRSITGVVSHKKRLENLQKLVERMAEYRKALNENNLSGAGLGKVFNRQKELFALKAVLLTVLMKIDRFKSRELDEMSERACKLAGAAWKETTEVLAREVKAGD